MFSRSTRSKACCPVPASMASSAPPDLPATMSSPCRNVSLSRNADANRSVAVVPVGLREE